MAVGTGLEIAPERGGTAGHDGLGSTSDVEGQERRLFVNGERVLEDRLQGHEGHRDLYLRLMGWEEGFVLYRITPTIPATSG
jgi:hypothetical protein